MPTTLHHKQQNLWRTNSLNNKQKVNKGPYFTPFEKEFVGAMSFVVAPSKMGFMGTKLRWSKKLQLRENLERAFVVIMRSIKKLKDMLKMIKKENLFQIGNDSEIFSWNLSSLSGFDREGIEERNRVWLVAESARDKIRARAERSICISPLDWHFNIYWILY